MIIGKKALIIVGLKIKTKPSIIHKIPSINSKLTTLYSFGLVKYDIVCIIPSISKKHPKQIKITFKDVSGLNIKNSDKTIKQIESTMDPFAYLCIYLVILIPPV